MVGWLAICTPSYPATYVTSIIYYVSSPLYLNSSRSLRYSLWRALKIEPYKSLMIHTLQVITMSYWLCQCKEDLKLPSWIDNPKIDIWCTYIFAICFLCVPSCILVFLTLAILLLLSSKIHLKIMPRLPAAKVRPMVDGSQGFNGVLRVSRSICWHMPIPILSNRSGIMLNISIFKCLPVRLWAGSQIAYESEAPHQHTFVCVQTLTLKKDAWAYHF